MRKGVFWIYHAKRKCDFWICHAMMRKGDFWICHAMKKGVFWVYAYSKDPHQIPKWYNLIMDLSFTSIYEPAHDEFYNKTCMTSKDSDQPVHSPGKARVLVYSSLNRQEAVEATCDQRRL